MSSPSCASDVDVRAERRLLASVFLSNLADGLRIAGFPLLAVASGASALEVALVASAATVSWAVFGPSGGAIADEHGPLSAIRVGQVVRIATYAVLAVPLAIGEVDWRALLVASLLVGVGEVAVDTGSQAIIPDLVPPVRLNSVAARTARAEMVGNDLLAGPFSAALFAIGAWAFGVSGLVLCALALVPALWLPARPQPKRPESWGTVLSPIRQAVVGLRLLVRSTELRRLAVIAGGMNFLVAAAGANLATRLVRDIGLSEGGYGIALLAGAVGGLVGASIAPTITGWLGRNVALGLAIVVGGLGQALLGMSSVAPVVLIAMASASIGIAGASVVIRALRLSLSEDRARGRITASFRLVGQGAVPVGGIIGGMAVEAVGSSAAFALTGSLLVGLGILVLVRPNSATRSEGDVG